MLTKEETDLLTIAARDKKMSETIVVVLLSC